MTGRIALSFVLVMAGLGGCAVGPNYRTASPAALGVPDRFKSEAKATPTAPVDLARWWTGFNDPVLTGLVERSLAQNLDIDAAGARLRQARASIASARSAQLPTLNGSGSIGRSIGNSGRSIFDPTTGTTISTGGDTTVYRAGFDAAYEVDVFGGIRRSVEAARADTGAALANLQSAQQTVVSEVGLNYVSARLAQNRLRIARDNLRTQDETVEIVGWRVQAGLVSSLDLEQARQLRAQTAATIPTLENNYATAANRIAVLLGEAPGAVDALLTPERIIPLAPPATDIPAAVIQRRPDVASAERSLAAETARIGVQEAELYPALRLTGSFAGSDTNLSDVVSGALGNLLASVSAPIFQGGRLRAAVEGQRASTDAALANYRQTVLTALEDVENALTALDTSERREREIVIAETAARNAAIYARSQYRAGLIDFQTVLDSERTLLSSQDSRATARADRATATVQLYKALGGGWQSAPLPASATRSGTIAVLPDSGTRP
ncbi:MAG TPA: efflux transporter outer membrane subunit [Sphingomonas sp.]|jgi:NodT family efflux transporter outer membrane factor (OMF) lipoprotein|uniref:efflux transporter outer membrane subunit n=1 Tax=Sphingomonas sp. TaxID=28214 RepID=UPI002EDB9F60